MRDLTPNEKDHLDRILGGRDRWVYRLTLTDSEADVIRAYCLGRGLNPSIRVKDDTFTVDCDTPERAEEFRNALFEIKGYARDVDKVARE